MIERRLVAVVTAQLLVLLLLCVVDCGTASNGRSSSSSISNSNKPKKAVVISHDRAVFLTKQRVQELGQDQSGGSASTSLTSLSSFLGGLVPKAGFLPIFPTHSTDGISYGDHRSTYIRGFTTGNLTLSVFITEFNDFDYRRDKESMLWQIHAIQPNWNYSESPSIDINVTVTENMCNKGLVLAHVFLFHSNHFSFSSSFQVNDLHNNKDLLEKLTKLPQQNNKYVYNRFPMNKFKIKNNNKLVSLLDRGSSEVNDGAKVSVVVGGGVGGVDDEKALGGTELGNRIDDNGSFWIPTLNLNLVIDEPSFSRNSIPYEIGKHMHFFDDGTYDPIIYRNTFSTLSSSLIEINNTVAYLPLRISYGNIAFWKWNVMTSLEEQWSSQHSALSEKDNDVIREMIFNTNPYILALTFAVSIVHSIFDILVFKNDIQFWRNKKSLQGLSLNSLLINCFFQTIILLYLFDNETSYLILVSSSIALVIEYWKITKAFSVSLLRQCDCWIPFKFSIAYSSSYSKHETSEHDSTAITHLLYILFPLILGYSAYSLIHLKHKSFYSWTINSLVGFVYAFGFILMTPQLFINYRLKSVAHMPWRSMVYKALNTFIDDLFAFIITMPLMHRLACFRDDIIFFIYIYQMWAYKVDHSRVNEFGQTSTSTSTSIVKGSDESEGEPAPEEKDKTV